jgi:hypothetical protein
MNREKRTENNKNNFISAIITGLYMNWFSENQKRKMRKAGLAFQKNHTWFYTDLAIRIQNSKKYDLAKQVVTYLLGYSQVENGFSYDSLLIYFLLDRKGIDYMTVSFIEDEMYEKLGLVRSQVENYLINLQECYNGIITVDLLGGLENITIKNNVDIFVK